MCSHVLAAAEKMGCLDEAIQSYRRMKHPISYTAARTYGFSKNVVKKPGTASKCKRLAICGVFTFATCDVQTGER